MERIRIGNDIAISWALFENNGATHLINAGGASVSLNCGGYTYIVPSFSVQGNVVSFIFPAEDQVKTGKYKIVLTERNESGLVSSYDVRDAFVLVPENEMLNVGYTQQKNVEITSVITHAAIANIKTISIVESEEEGGDNVVTFVLTDGSQFHMTVKNGSKGERGDTGATGATGPKGDKGDVGERGPKGVESVTASVDGTSGTPPVTPTYDGTTGTLGFAFSGLKGEKGDKGDQGNSGFQGDYTDLEIVNGLEETVAGKALDATQGKALDSKISQLGQEIKENSRIFSVTEQIDSNKLSLIDGYVNSSGIQEPLYGFKYAYVDLHKYHSATIKIGSVTAGNDAFPLVLDSDFNIIIPGTTTGGTYNLDCVQGIYINNYNDGRDSFELSFSELYESTPNYYGYKNKGFITPNDGVLNPTSYNWYSTDFIPVHKGDVLSITCDSSNSALAAFYDAEKNYLHDISILDGSGYETRTVTVPDGAAFMRSSGFEYMSSERVEFVSRVPVREICSEQNLPPLDKIIEESVAAMEELLPKDSIEITTSDFKYGDFIYYVDGAAAANPDYHRTDYINVEGYDRLYVDIECEYLSCCAFYTDNDEQHYTGIHFVTSSSQHKKIVTIPYGVKYVRLSNNNAYATPSARLYKARCFFDGKKAAIYGTSIEAGYGKVTGVDSREKLLDVFSYVSAACKKNGITPLNFAVPSGALTGSGDLAFIDDTTTINYNGVDGSICGVNYQNAMLDLIGTANDPDIFIFAFTYNDAHRKQWNNLEDGDTQDYNSLNTSTYVGAFNFILKALFTAKPSAKVIIMTHFSDDSAVQGEGKDYIKFANEVTENIAAYWNVPCLKMRHKVEFICNSWIDNHSAYIWDDVHVANYTPGNDVPELLERLSYIVKKELEMLA